MNMFYRLFKSLVILLTVVTVTIGLVGYLMLSPEPIVVGKTHLLPAEIQAAKQKIKHLREKLISPDKSVRISLSKQDLDSFSAVASHTIPFAEVRTNLGRFGMSFFTTIEIDYFGKRTYLNASCMLLPGNNSAEFNNCYIGDVSLPGALVRWGLDTMTFLVFDSDVEDTLSSLFANAKFQESELILTLDKDYDLQEKVRSSMKDIANTIKSVHRSSDVKPEIVAIYVAHIQSLGKHNRSLAYYVGEVMGLALTRSESSDILIENTAAIWALASTFGSYRFSGLAGLNELPERFSVTLAGRQDLALHFIYSVVLQQIGRVDFGIKVGEVKELLDSTQGGSGFSFADLAADKAGLQFGRFLTNDYSDAKRALKRLALTNEEALFFPDIRDLPEGISERDFLNDYQNVASVKYKEIESTIDQRITRLPLYARPTSHPANSMPNQ